ncbi:MAG TPA: hypothetical protein VD997_05740 [Phycisphaerales bacterium]|nr:hypothetical protein [Phycisphaerales bacterium]
MSPTPENGGLPGPNVFSGGHLMPSPGPRWPTNWASRGVMSLIGRSVRAFSELASFVQTTDDATCARQSTSRIDESNWPSRPLRIGIVSPGAWSRFLTQSQGLFVTEWETLDSEEPDASLCRDHVLDAVLRRHADKGLSIEVCESPDLDAAWFDWSVPCPLSYPATFPARLDPARVTLNDITNDDARLVRALIDTAALLSRYPARLTNDDRVKGRRPFQGSGDTPGEIDTLSVSLQALSYYLTFAPVSDASRAASRVLGAHLATSPNWPDDRSRISGMDVCGRLSGDEAQTMLRLAAVRVSMTEDSAGLDALERADRMLRDNQLISATTQEAFIVSELEHGHPGPLTIGRLAAGICMLVSTMPASRVPYFRDDLLEDMRFSSLLIGRDQDRRLLMEVFRMLERVRRAESFGLPVATPVQARVASDETTAAPAKAKKPVSKRKPRTGTTTRKKAA